MGDGFYRKNRGGVFLCTDSYTPKEVELLVETLINKFGLTASKQKRIDGVYRIYIHKKSIDTLVGLVKPYFIPSMLYKLGLNSTIAVKDSDVKVKPSLFSQKEQLSGPRIGRSVTLAATTLPSRRNYSTLVSRASCTFINNNKTNSMKPYLNKYSNKIIKCLKWLSYSNHSELNFMLMLVTPVQKRFFFSKNLKSHQRIGPHNLNIISLIVGSLLSSSYMERRSDELDGGVRIIFIKYSDNVESIMWFYSTLAKAGYCSYKKPKLCKFIGKGNKVLFFYVLKSYSFSSFN